MGLLYTSLRSAIIRKSVSKTRTFSLYSRIYPFTNGIFETWDVIYFVYGSVSVFSLFNLWLGTPKHWPWDFALGDINYSGVTLLTLGSSGHNNIHIFRGESRSSDSIVCYLGTLSICLILLCLIEWGYYPAIVTVLVTV